MRRMKKRGPNVLYDLNDLLFFLTFLRALRIVLSPDLHRMNFEHLFYKKKLIRFLHSLMRCKNDVAASVREVFVVPGSIQKHSANVKPCDNKAKSGICWHAVLLLI